MPTCGRIAVVESQSIWSTGNQSEELAPYLDNVIGSAVTTTVSVSDVTKSSSLYVTVGNEDIDGLITVFVGSKCPVEKPRPNVMKMELTNNKNDIAVFRYLERGNIYCEDLN